MNACPFKVGETYPMRFNGEQVKVIDVDPSQPAHRVVAIRHANGLLGMRYADGRVSADDDSPGDLMPPKRVVWVNFYPNGRAYYSDNAEEARAIGGITAIATAVRVELP